MIRPWHSLLLLACSCASLVLSCASEQVQIIENDDDDEQGGRDVGGSVDTFGEPCDSADDCDSELCLFDPAFDEQYCSRTCEVSCDQQGWSCVEITVGDDTRSVCLRDEIAAPDADADESDDDGDTASDPSDTGVRPDVPDTVVAPDVPDAVTTPDVPDTGPTTCPGVCSPGQTENQTTSCGACGTGTLSQSRTCTDACAWGPWADVGACNDPGTVCAPGSIEREERACSGCGVEFRTRDCATDGCGYGAWGEWSGCGATVCTAGQTDTETRSCGPCGATQTRTRGCNGAVCNWNDWSDWSPCPGRTCSPGATTNCENNDSCGQRVCNSSCEWGACEPRVAGGCLRIRPGTSGPEGNNWRCCGASSWQFCLTTCRWSTDCAPCSGCGC